MNKKKSEHKHLFYSQVESVRFRDVLNVLLMLKRTWDLYADLTAEWERF